MCFYGWVTAAVCDLQIQRDYALGYFPLALHWFNLALELEEFRDHADHANVQDLRKLVTQPHSGNQRLSKRRPP